jgi:hypothetical protein
MVLDGVWPIEPDGGVLCIGCLEKRIGRRLKTGISQTASATVAHGRRASACGRA